MSADRELSKLADDSMMLLQQAQRRGIQIDEADRKAILTLRTEVLAGKTDIAIDTQSAAFGAEANIANKFKPITIDGLRATDYSTVQEGHSWQRLAAYLTMYWFSFGAAIPALAFRVVYTYSVLALIVLAAVVGVIQATNSQIAYFSLLNQSVAKNQQVSIERKAKSQEIEDLNKKLDATPAPSDEAADVMERKLSELRLEDGRLSVAAEQAASTYMVALDRLGGPDGQIDVGGWFGLSQEPAKDYGANKFATQISVLLAVKIALIVQLGFFVPALAALLGSCVFSLRGIAREIAEDTFTEASQIQYRVRMILSPLCGIVVGLLVVGSDIPMPGQSFADLTADLLADTMSSKSITLQFTSGFLVGYSVEFLFSIVDGAIGAVKPRKSEGNKPS
ncbi:hypothetical protein [Dongia sp.]|uniref:hypothetical protein n=1 Tax=Dongia sp. TaxID=1977262 RepID=UPI0035B2D355